MGYNLGVGGLEEMAQCFDSKASDAPTIHEKLMRIRPQWRRRRCRSSARSPLSIDRLHQKGYISDPATKAKSVVLTEEGAKRSQDLFEKYFTKST
jgi:hypothetical protein